MVDSDNDIHTQEWYAQRIEYLRGFMTPERAETLERVLGQRTRYVTICTENTFHPQNASALVRTAEAFGLQEIHNIEMLCSFKPNVQIVKGTDKWVEIYKHRSTEEGLDALRSSGYRIVATSPHIDGRTPETFDVSAGPFALIFGTEHAGISQQTLESADEFIQVPMYGMVESLNVSACASILLYNLTERMRGDESIDWRLGEDDRTRLLYKWMCRTVRDSKRILGRRFGESE